MIKDKCKYCKKVCIRTGGEKRLLCDNVKCDRQHLKFLFEEWRKGNLNKFVPREEGKWS